MAGENDAVKPATQLQALDARTHRLGVLDVGKHRSRLIDRRSPEAKSDELPCNPARTTPEFKHRTARRDRLRDSLPLAHLRQQRIQLHRATVRRSLHAPIVAYVVPSTPRSGVIPEHSPSREL